MNKFFIDLFILKKKKACWFLVLAEVTDTSEVRVKPHSMPFTGDV
jgi:hypothetical protein